MSEEKYEVIQAFTKEDYIVAHHTKYGWTNFKSSCKEFQDDMAKWGAYFSIIDGVKLGSIHDRQKYNLSNNFWAHAVRFGFIKRVEEVLDYNNNIIAESNEHIYILAKNGISYNWLSLENNKLQWNSHCDWRTPQEAVNKSWDAYNKIYNFPKE